MVVRIPAEFDGKIKTPGILLLALLSCLLLPAPSLGLTLVRWLETFHMMDLNQLYTVLFCLWFLAPGAIEYLVLRWCGVAGFRSNAKPGRARLSGRDVVLFTVGARRQIEGPGETRVKVCESSHTSGRYRRPADRCHADRGGQQQLPREYSAPGSPFIPKNSRCRCHFEYPAWRAISSIRSG